MIHFNNLPLTEQVGFIQPMSLYKFNCERHTFTINTYVPEGWLFYLILKNKKTKRIYFWNTGSNKWQKAKMPNGEKLEPTSSLDFLICTGTSFAASVEKNFGLFCSEKDKDGT